MPATASRRISNDKRSSLSTPTAHLSTWGKEAVETVAQSIHLPPRPSSTSTQARKSVGRCNFVSKGGDDFQPLLSTVHYYYSRFVTWRKCGRVVHPPVVQSSGFWWLSWRGRHAGSGDTSTRLRCICGARDQYHRSRSHRWMTGISQYSMAP